MTAGHDNDVTTRMIDLGDCSFEELRKHSSPELDGAIEQVLRQVERPRVNLGASGPPGRVD